jgi:hypothetical protein
VHRRGSALTEQATLVSMSTANSHTPGPPRRTTASSRSLQRLNEPSILALSDTSATENSRFAWNAMNVSPGFHLQRTVRYEERAVNSIRFYEWMAQLERFFLEHAENLDKGRLLDILCRHDQYTEHEAEIISIEGPKLFLPLDGASLYRKPHSVLRSHKQKDEKTRLQRMLGSLPDHLSTVRVSTFTFTPRQNFGVSTLG